VVGRGQGGGIPLTRLGWAGAHQPLSPLSGPYLCPAFGRRHCCTCCHFLSSDGMDATDEHLPPETTFRAELNESYGHMIQASTTLHHMQQWWKRSVNSRAAPARVAVTIWKGRQVWSWPLLSDHSPSVPGKATPPGSPELARGWILLPSSLRVLSLLRRTSVCSCCGRVMRQ
jgi:hypothetical protein